EIQCFSTKIHKDSLLPKFTKTEILKNQPCNSEIKYEAPKYIETTLKNTRSFLLDSLSYTNELRKQQSLKIILLNYASSLDRKEVFSKELGAIIEKENTTNKLFDKIANSHKRQQFQKSNFKLTYIKNNSSTIMEVAQDYITQILQQMNKSLYTCKKK
ncbi:17372_t:CDS:2, partial [Gigaspora rosea]